MSLLTPIFLLWSLTCLGLRHEVDCEEVTGTCTSQQFKYCKLDIDPALFTKGAKGVRGDEGYNGLQGEQGERGVEGAPGVTGPQGPRGESGDMGDKGEKGDVPQNNIVGLPGPPGIPGVFTDSSSEDDTSDFPCDYDNPEVNETPISVEPLSYRFQAYCGPNPREICISQKDLPGRLYDYTDKVKPFWMSEIGMDLKKIYGPTAADFEWLKENSTYIRQTLRYHCNNSKPYNARDIAKAVRLLTWNDKVVGPYPSDTFPLFYSVPPASDGCSNPSIGSKYTDIVIQTAVVNRLPIIDVQINDIRDEPQSFYIEHVELCFAVFYLYVENDDE